MKLTKWLFPLLLLSLLSLFAPAALAQDITYGLSQEDFAAFTAALENSGSQSDFSFSYSGSLDTVTGEGTSGISFVGEGAVSGGGLQLTMSGDLTDPSSGAQPYSTEVRFVENALYVDFGGMWISASEADVTALGEQFGPMLGAGATDMTDPSALMTEPGMMEAVTAIQDIDPESFVSIARGEEGGLTTYTTTVNLSDLLSNEGVRELVLIGARQGASAAGGGQDALTEEQLDQVVAGLSNSTVSFTHSINPSTQLVEGFSLAVSIPVDLSAMSDVQATDPLEMTLVLDVTISGYGTSTEIAVPETSTPVSEFLGMMMGGMSG